MYSDILIKFGDMFKVENCVQLNQALNGGENGEIFEDKQIVLTINKRCSVDVFTILDYLGERQIHSLNLIEDLFQKDMQPIKANITKLFLKLKGVNSTQKSFPENIGIRNIEYI